MNQSREIAWYQKLMAQAPRIKVSGLEGDYRALAEFNNVVLAGWSSDQIAMAMVPHPLVPRMPPALSAAPVHVSPSPSTLGSPPEA